MEKKNCQITAIVGKNHVFLLGNCDLAAQTRPDYWWMGSPPLAPAPVMEGSSWHRGTGDSDICNSGLDDEYCSAFEPKGD